ncbi:MAG: C40 family peptidase [bacterium]
MRKLCIILLLGLIGCASVSQPIFVDQSELRLTANLPRVDREDLLNEVSIYRGVRYKEGGCDIKGIDCSCLVQKVYFALGIELPRTVGEQFECGIRVSKSNVRTGDLVFFGSGSKPTHVGIAVSRGQIIHTSMTRGVVVDRIDDLGREIGFFGAKRIANIE